MPRSLVSVVVIAIVLIAAMVVLSRIDPTKSPKHVEKIVPENALAH
jgi:hypothetical protein